MARRYCGAVTIRVTYHDFGGYRGNVSANGVSTPMAVQPPACGYGPGIAYDSSAAYDSAARAMLSFASNGTPEYDEFTARGYDGDYLIRRSK